jgi:hypothetical protein
MYCHTTAQDTVSKAIRLLWGKCKNGSGMGQETDYVLKAQGLKEYLEGEQLFFNYAYVRQCIRDGKEIELSMVKRPLPPTPAPPTSAAAAANGTPLTPEQKQAMAEQDYLVRCVALSGERGLSDANTPCFAVDSNSNLFFFYVMCRRKWTVRLECWV